ncbi:MAG: cysteine--tRNA ligase, partial [Salinispira sp.]
MTPSKPILNLYNTASRCKEPLTVRDNMVKIYACGPTVYNYIHIGNFRTFIAEDILRRTLTFFGYELHHVMNITDIGHLSDDGDGGEDKMLRSAREQQRSILEIAEYFTEVFLKDSALLNIERPDVLCKASDHIPEMIEMITVLQKKGYAYGAGGNVYFDVAKVADYGKMARLNFSNERSRVGTDSVKRNPHDFVLWFTKSKFENHALNWNSPWGRGYPGWHIECSAMSLTFLGEQFDIHCGGTDLIPVHHSNEIAQSEAFSGKSPWVRFWFHSAFLLLDRGKMSRSSGTFLTVKNLLNMKYHPLDYRYLVLGAHYRTQLHFSDESMSAAGAARSRLYRFVKELQDFPPAEELGAAASRRREACTAALADDLNTPKALAELWALVKDS